MEKHFAPNGWPKASALASLEHAIPERRPHWSWDAEAARALRLARSMSDRMKLSQARAEVSRRLLDL